MTIERIETTTIGEAMAGERSFIEVPPVTEHVTVSPAVQDWRDGEALRRLREALPKRVRIEVVLDVALYGGSVAIRTSGADYDYAAMGATVAEAADTCREAFT